MKIIKISYSLTVSWRASTFGLTSKQSSFGRWPLVLGCKYPYELLSHGVEVDGLELGEGSGHVQELEVGASLSIHLHGQDKGALARLLGIDHHLDADRADGLDDHLCALLERLSLLTVLDDEPALSTDFAGSIHQELSFRITEYYCKRQKTTALQLHSERG